MKKLYKTDENVISAVCGGIRVYFGIDPVIIRILFIIFLISNLGIYPILSYFIMASMIPAENNIIDINN